MTGIIGWLVSAVIGGVIAIVSPELIANGWLSEVQLISIAAGLATFALAALVFEVGVRQGVQEGLRGRVQAVGTLAQKVRAEAKREMAKIRQDAAAPNAEIETIASDVNILKNLVAQLSDHKVEAKQTLSPARAQSTEKSDAQGAAVPLAVGNEPISPPESSREERLFDTVREALRNDQVDLYLTPIIALPQRKVGFYDCFLHLRSPDGTIIAPAQYLQLAERAGLIATVDNIRLVRSVQLVRRMRRRQQQVGFFCQIDGETLRDREFFADFIGFMRDNRDLSGSLMFELNQRDIYRLDSETEAELDKLVKLGFRFAMGETTNLDLFVSDLSTKGFRFVKVRADILLAKLSKQGDPRALKRALDPGAIDLIVTHIDSEATLLDMLDYAVDFGTGKVFGEPHRDEQL